MTSELKAGTRLSQLEIGTEFKISRHHVREVFRILHAERLITMQPNVGIKVSPLGVLDFEEVHNLRLLLEPMLARMAVPTLTRSQIAALRELLTIMAETDDTHVWLDAHERFHAVIYRQAGRPWMVHRVARSPVDTWKSFTPTSDGPTGSKFTRRSSQQWRRGTLCSLES